MTTYDRLKLRSGRTLVLRDATVIAFLGGRAWTGIVVDREGEDVVVRRDGQVIDETRQIVDVALVAKVTPMRMNLTYGRLERTSDWDRAPREARPKCDHDWQEQPGEPPVDVCYRCGATRR
jgi:hypothetical protein